MDRIGSQGEWQVPSVGAARRDAPNSATCWRTPALLQERAPLAENLTRVAFLRPYCSTIMVVITPSQRPDIIKTLTANYEVSA